MAKYYVDIKLDDLEVPADTRVDAMFYARSLLPSRLWSYISNMSARETPESKKARAEAEGKSA